MISCLPDAFQAIFMVASLASAPLLQKRLDNPCHQLKVQQHLLATDCDKIRLVQNLTHLLCQKPD